MPRDFPGHVAYKRDPADYVDSIRVQRTVVNLALRQVFQRNVVGISVVDGTVWNDDDLFLLKW